jgi:hypothetical protein
VPEGQLLVAVGQVIDRVQVEGQVPRRRLDDHGRAEEGEDLGPGA